MSLYKSIGLDYIGSLWTNKWEPFSKSIMQLHIWCCNNNFKSFGFRVTAAFYVQLAGGFVTSVLGGLVAIAQCNCSYN